MIFLVVLLYGVYIHTTLADFSNNPLQMKVKKVKYTFRLEPDLKEKAAKIAEERGVSFSAYVRVLIRKALQMKTK